MLKWVLHWKCHLANILAYHYSYFCTTLPPSKWMTTLVSIAFYRPLTAALHTVVSYRISSECILPLIMNFSHIMQMTRTTNFVVEHCVVRNWSGDVSGADSTCLLPRLLGILMEDPKLLQVIWHTAFGWCCSSRASKNNRENNRGLGMENTEPAWHSSATSLGDSSPLACHLIQCPHQGFQYILKPSSF